MGNLIKSKIKNQKMRSFLIATAVMISGVFAQLPEKCPDRTSI